MDPAIIIIVVVISIAAEHDGDGGLLVLIGLMAHVGEALEGGAHPCRGAHLVELAAKVERHRVAVILELALYQHAPVVFAVGIIVDVLPGPAGGRAGIQRHQRNFGLIGDFHIPRRLVVVVAEVVYKPDRALAISLLKSGDVHLPLFLVRVLDGKAHLLYALTPADDLVAGPQQHSVAVVTLDHEAQGAVLEIYEVIVGICVCGKVKIVHSSYICQGACRHQ